MDKFTETVVGRKAIERVLDGMAELASAVSVTLGPHGLTVIVLQQDAKTIVTKDGVTVARSIVPRGTLERAGANLLREAAESVHSRVGDGTTTATVLAHSLTLQCCKLVAAG